MISDDAVPLGWELIGWDRDEHAAHVSALTREEILRLRDLFPSREDELLATAVYEVSPDLHDAMRKAIPHLEFREGLDYQIGGFRLPSPSRKPEASRTRTDLRKHGS
ncbi:hypothetical protein HY68_36185 [Streptomyces sp. AcH 505]|uniref:hypothetical protein n=1 Tax=Streptomyces sp. AcH 505 TaxID=352211 RepID=UPI0005921692|nr:hypothetical protein HY68_36185 [Streptomyces sp. AcH 505]